MAAWACQHGHMRKWINKGRQMWKQHLPHVRDWLKGLRVRHINLFFAMAFSLAGAVAIAIVAAWVLAPQLNVGTQSTPPADLTRLALTIAAGVGGVVALVVAYRRQRDLEQGRFVEGFGAAAKQLGDADVAVRLAGVYAMAGVADQTSKLKRQQCIDVLCGYLRLPYCPALGDNHQSALILKRPMRRKGGSEEELRFEYRQNDKEVRQTIVRVIVAHLQEKAATSWSPNDFDFTGSHLEEPDFGGALFSGGTTSFQEATFSGRASSFYNATFTGGTTSFYNATFSGGITAFYNATFSGETTTFTGATFSGKETSFKAATFSGGTTSFRNATFSGGETSFENATFSGEETSFTEATFSGEYTMFTGATFSGKTTWFDRATFSGGITLFEGAPFSGEYTMFTGVTFSGKTTWFDGAIFSGTTSFDGGPSVASTPRSTGRSSAVSTPRSAKRSLAAGRPRSTGRPLAAGLPCSKRQTSALAGLVLSIRGYGIQLRLSTGIQEVKWRV